MPEEGVRDAVLGGAAGEGDPPAEFPKAPVGRDGLLAIWLQSREGSGQHLEDPAVNQRLAKVHPAWVPETQKVTQSASSRLRGHLAPFQSWKVLASHER